MAIKSHKNRPFLTKAIKSHKFSGFLVFIWFEKYTSLCQRYVLMSYIIAEHQSATQENGASHKKVIFFLAKIAIKSDNSL